MTMRPRQVDLVLRAAAEGDVEAIQRVAREAWDDAYESQFGPAHRRRVLEHLYSRPALLRDIARHGSFFYVAALDAKVIGFGEQVQEDRCGEVVRVIVCPAFQRRGVGTALLRIGLAALARAGVEEVSAAVEVEDVACRGLLERNSFAPSNGEVAEPGEDLVEMSRTLDAAAGREDAASVVTVWIDDEPAAAAVAAAKPKPPRLATVLRTTDACRLSFAESALEAAGIPFVLHAESPGGSGLRVPLALAATAREILAELDEDSFAAEE